MADLRAVDRAHVWHPYAPMPSVVAPLVVESASGVRLRLADGRELVDGMSSWWAAIHGYRHPVLDAAVPTSSARMSHVMFGGLTHGPAVDLAGCSSTSPRPGWSTCSSPTPARCRSRSRSRCACSTSGRAAGRGSTA